MTDNRKRLTKITTRAGDSGKTKLATGRTVHKASGVVRSMGSIDELNSHIGLLLAHLKAEQQTHEPQLLLIQQNLFDMGAVFAMEGEFTAPDAATLEGEVESLNASLPPLTEFVLPRGGIAASASHVCRSVCRRAEGEVWAYIESLDNPTKAHTECAQYLNRLSDYFFVLARILTEDTETQWHGPGGDQ